jgi:predicted ATP-grasp superfamily ATP-dependent carboligase
VSGVSAAVLNYCEVRSFSAMCLMSVTPATLSVESMRRFEAVLPLLNTVLSSEGGSEFVLKLPTQAKYIAKVKGDPFLSRTESIYM